MAKHADPTRQIDDVQLDDEIIEGPADQTVDADTQDDDADLVAESGTEAKTIDEKHFPTMSRAAALGIIVVILLGGLSGWLGFQAYEARQAQRHRDLAVEAARQAAVNLTTIKFDEVERDIERILKSATGRFHDDFQARSEPFIDVVKRAQSKSEGTVTAAGITSQTENQTDVLVAISVTTSIPGAGDQPPRSWRMRITVEQHGNTAKVSDVQFVV